MLLLRAGDVESNPGPECGVCGRRTSARGPQCGKCRKWVHLKCSGMAKTAFYKQEGKEWLCGKCGGSNNATPGKDEGVCKCCDRSFRKNSNPAVCLTCKGKFHVSCSGIHKYHWKKITEWYCPECKLGGVSGVTARPTKPRSTAVLPKVNCDLCKKLVRSDQGVCCKNCRKRVHKVCSGVNSRVAMVRMLNNGGWECKECKGGTKLAHSQNREGVRTSDMVHGEGASVSVDSIRILQWNCDYLLAKISELEMKLEEWEIDVACIQETKLRAEDEDLVVKGFNVVRKDRKREGMSRYARGGGLITLIRKGIDYQSLSSNRYIATGDETTEIQCVQIIPGRGTILNIANVYIPPTSSRQEEESIDLNRLPKGKEWIVLGDVNAHHEAWDNFLNPDVRGEKIMEWVDAGRFMVINNGAATRIERGSGRLSTPDVSICHEETAGSSSWG